MLASWKKSYDKPRKWKKSEVTQSCLTLCDPMDCSQPGSSVHGIFQARVLQWVAISFFRGSSQPRNQTQVSLPVDRRSRQHVKKQRLHFVDKGLYSQSCSFSRSHVWMWQLDYKEGWVPNWCFRNVVLKKTLESSLDSKEIKPVNPKGNQPWIFTGRTDVKAEAPILWPPDVKSQLTVKKKAWCWERLRAGEVDDRGWDGCMASPTLWT